MPPKQKSKSRLDTEQPIKAWEQGLQSAIFSEEVYFLWIEDFCTVVYIVCKLRSAKMRGGKLRGRVRGRL